VARLEVRVQPRARRDEIAGERDGRLLVRVTAPPVDGKANAAVRRLLASRLGIPLRRVTVVRGEAARDKLIEIDGLEGAEVRRRVGRQA
jgi:uncharacterized protein (TIGR00251 family)